MTSDSRRGSYALPHEAPVGGKAGRPLVGHGEGERRRRSIILSEGTTRHGVRAARRQCRRPAMAANASVAPAVRSLVHPDPLLWRRMTELALTAGGILEMLEKTSRRWIRRDPRRDLMSSPEPRRTEVSSHRDPREV